MLCGNHVAAFCFFGDRHSGSKFFRINTYKSV